MYVNCDNNKVFINGRIISDFNFSHRYMGEEFYEFKVEVARKSGIYDVIPVIVSERIINVENNYYGRVVSVSGQYRSFNKHENGRTVLVLSVFAFTVAFEAYPFDTYENNSINITGFLCKEPIYRKTPLGRDIADIILAVNRGNGKSDYIPCIVWGRNAVYISRFGVGTKIGITGRVQSREYTKYLSDGNTLNRVAYEVSVSSLEVMRGEWD